MISAAVAWRQGSSLQNSSEACGAWHKDAGTFEIIIIHKIINNKIVSIIQVMLIIKIVVFIQIII